MAPTTPNQAVMAFHPNGSGLRVLRRSDTRFELFKPVWSPDRREFLVGCFDVGAQIDKLGVMQADGATCMSSSPRQSRRSRRGEWCSKAAGLDGPRPPRGS
jgi:hypothetical protein